MSSVDLDSVCFLCGSTELKRRKYLRLDSKSILRNIGYSLPSWFARLLGIVSKRFRMAYQPVLVNREYFDREAVYCRSCLTGRVIPEFDPSELNSYYRDFYWKNRDVGEGKHVPVNGQPNPQQLRLSRDRLDWIENNGCGFDSVIDFGAGDCAATFELIKKAHVHVVDPSFRAEELSREYGASYSKDFGGAPVVDLVYSAHSIEHVADLIASLRVILAHTKLGGHVFFETPNVGDEGVFDHLVHTPHTYMLSRESYGALESLLPVRVVALESCGPEWRVSHPATASAERADLRVLLQKIDVSNESKSA